MVLQHDAYLAAPGPGVETRAVVERRQDPAPRAQGRTGNQPSGQQLQEDLWLAVAAAHGSEHAGQRPIGAGDECRAERVGRPLPRPVFAGVPGGQVESDAPIVEEDAGAGLGQVAAEPCGVGLDEADAHALGVDTAQRNGAPGATVSPSTAARLRSMAARRGPRREGDRRPAPTAWSCRTSTR